MSLEASKHRKRLGYSIFTFLTANEDIDAAQGRVLTCLRNTVMRFNPLNAELNPICHLLALLGGATIVVVSRLRVKG